MEKSTERRHEEIRKYLLANERASVNEVARVLDVTPETIRKDFSFLENKGFLFRTHGGAVLRNSNVDIPLNVRTQEKMEIKRVICSKVINYIDNDNVVFIDPSSTALPLGRLICLKKNLLLVTNCFDLVSVAADSKHEIIMLGGSYSKTGKRTQGHFVVDMINRFSFDVAIFGLDGCDGLDGPGTQTEDAVFTNAAVMKRSKRNILIMDSSKFDRPARFQYAQFSDFDYLVTDQLPEALKGKINTMVIEVGNE